MIDQIFAACSILTLLCGLGVVFSRNPVYSAFSLILCFFSLAVLYLFMHASFVAMIQVLIYTGAIVVLFVFVVMLLNLAQVQSMGTTYSWLGILISTAGVVALAALLLQALGTSELFVSTQPASNDMRSISKLLFSQYLWPFEVLSLFLLALIVAIFSLSKPQGVEEGH